MSLEVSSMPGGRVEHPLPVTVIIPVFNALSEVSECIQSVLQKSGRHFRLLLLDDASTDPRMAGYLNDVADSESVVRVIRNERNQGFTASVNIGCAHADGDVVLLNSDTRVTEGWLHRLADAALSRPRVATVTPLSNAAGAFSIPRNNRVNRLPTGWSDEDMAALTASCSDHLLPEVPTGNSFCLYIRREALEQVGPFDEKRFPEGYGEENDFCMRAMKKGFVHLVEDGTFVFHHRSVSFGARKKSLKGVGQSVMRELHPDYDRLVMNWLRRDPLDPMRRRMRRALLRQRLNRLLRR